jgi:DNA-binding NarL/FixJ family response regulator
MSAVSANGRELQVGRHHATSSSPVGPSSLTPFERRILELRAAGFDRNEIARMMKRSPQTISNSLTVAKEKLCARSLIEAAVVLSIAETV